MRRALMLAALAFACRAVAEDPPPSAPPDPELLEFLGEMAGEDPHFVEFMATRAAKRALKDAGKAHAAERKEDEDE